MARSQLFEISSHRAGAPRAPRLPEPHPNHHLWRNGRLWWVAFTVHLPPWQKERVRLSLGTADIHEARRLRDELLRRYPQTRECALSLRLAPSRPRRRDRRDHGPLAA